MKLIKEYQKAIERLYNAYEWLSSTKYETWEQVRDNQYKIYNEHESVVEKIEFLSQEMINRNIIPNWEKVAE